MLALPAAGSGASAYQSWIGPLAPAIELHAVALPGRESRWREPPYREIDTAVSSIAQALEQQDASKPWVLFGQSMGALMAYELAVRLERVDVLRPFALIVVSHAAPDLPYAEPLRAEMTDQQIALELRKMGGTPERILQSKEMLSLILPALRYDVALCQQHQHVARPRLRCPVLVYYGDRDELLPLERVQGWRETTAGATVLRTLPGGHFLASTSPDALLAAIQEDLAGLR